MAMVRTSGRMNNDREDSGWKTTEGKDLPQMAFHHIIGERTLRDTWNKLLSVADQYAPSLREDALPVKAAEANKMKKEAVIQKAVSRAEEIAPRLKTFLAATQTGEAFITANYCLKAQMRLAGVPESETESYLTELLLVHSGTKPAITAFDYGELGTRISWPGWNLIEGPEGKLREDDDCDGYALDDFQNALMLCGKMKEFQLVLKVHQLYHAMANFIKFRREFKAKVLKPKGLRDDDMEAHVVQHTMNIEALASTYSLMLQGGAPDASQPLSRWNPCMWVKLKSPKEPGKPWHRKTLQLAGW
ncbi:MAG: hypothetical protein ACLQGP_27445 [Isosphaeraceae bacterium]